MTQNRNVPLESWLNHKDIVRLLTLFEFDGTESLWWRHRDGKLAFYVNCNDVFYWGTSDCEQINSEDIADLEKAYDDTSAVASDYVDLYFGILWVARKRQIRPQGAYYKEFSYDGLTDLAELFDQAGPARETDIANPQDRERWRL